MTSTAPPQNSRLDRLLGAVERGGNRLPDPFVLFLALFLLVGLISSGLAWAGTRVQVPGRRRTRRHQGAVHRRGPVVVHHDPR